MHTFCSHDQQFRSFTPFLDVSHQRITRWLWDPYREFNCIWSIQKSSRWHQLLPMASMDHQTPENSWLVLATDPGNSPAVRVWTRKKIQFSSRTVQRPNSLLLGGPNLALYPSTLGFRQVWLDLSGPISGFAFRVVLGMVAFRYPTVNRKILTMVH